MNNIKGKNMKKLLLTAIFLLGLSQPASAQIQLVDNLINTLDPVTNLEWLDLTETLGMTQQEVEDNFNLSNGKFREYRVATIQELDDFQANAGLPSTPSNISGVFFNIIKEFVDLLGETGFNDPPGVTSHRASGRAEIGFFRTYVYSTAGIPAGTAFISNSIGLSPFGHFIVRDFTGGLHANAGLNFNINEGGGTVLQGDFSYNNIDTLQLKYTWTQLIGTPVVLDEPSDRIRVSFPAPQVGMGGEVLTFQLVVSELDGSNPSPPDTVDITVTNTNKIAVADAGVDFTVKAGGTGQLDASASFDPDGEPIVEYLWIQTGPAGTPLGTVVSLLPDNTVVNPTFDVPFEALGELLSFKVLVSDGALLCCGNANDPSFPDVVGVTIVENSVPIADAGPNQSKDEGNLVTLNGLASFDTDLGDTLSYQWTQTAGPTVILDDDTLATPTFIAVANAGGSTLVFELVVTDDDVTSPASSVPDQVEISVFSLNDPPNCLLAFVEENSIWPPNHSLDIVIIDGISDPDGDEVTITITGITQDEEVEGTGTRITTPDALILEGSVLVRAERSGTEDGRVYEISFSASDGTDSCNGSVNVEVPHNRNGATAIDNGQVFNSIP